MDIDLGVIETEGERIVGYREKPKLDYEVSMGIYVYDERALAHLPAERRLPVPRPRAAAARRGRERRRATAATPSGSTSARSAEHQRAVEAFERAPEVFAA